MFCVREQINGGQWVLVDFREYLPSWKWPHLPRTRRTQHVPVISDPWLSSSSLLLADADWCPPCKAIAPYFASQALELEQVIESMCPPGISKPVVLAKLDVDDFHVSIDLLTSSPDIFPKNSTRALTSQINASGTLLLRQHRRHADLQTLP